MSTPKPLTILVHETLAQTPEIQALQEQGHIIFPLIDMGKVYDLILAPNAWQMSETLLKYLPMALRAARTTRYGGKKADGKGKTRTTNRATGHKEPSDATSVSPRRRRRKTGDHSGSVPPEL